MSCPVNLQALPSAVFEEFFTAENVRGRTLVTPLTPLSFPKSRSALWDGSPAGEKLCLQLCSHRKPRLVLLEKALRLAQRHVRHSNKLHLHCFFLGSVSVDSDEEGVTVTLDRFDPGRDQAGSSSRVPSALLPGDILVPCLFSTQTEAMSDAVVQSEAELHHCFKVLQQFVSSRQTLDLSQLLKVRARVVCSQQADAAVFGLSWSAVCPSVCVELEPVRAVPVIPTALLRSLTSTSRALLQQGAARQRGFLTMDQTRKLLLLLESDPKASNLPLVGLWLSGITHIYNPQVWAWCLRFLFSSALQDRVLSESGCFLLVLFGATHRAPQFFQCRAPGPQLDCQLLTAFQSVTLYQVVPVDGQTLQCELRLEDHSRQMEVFQEAQSSFSRAPPPAAGLSVSDQDSGVEDEDFSPRPSPSPHAPAQQTRRVQPSVPELSLLIDSSFTSNQHGWKDPGSAHRPPSAADRKFGPPAGNSSTSNSSDPRSAPPQLHSTPNSNLQQPCTCCSPHTYDCTSVFSSPRLHPAAHHSSHHHAPPSRNPPSSPSVPPSSPHGAHTSSHHPAPSASTHRPIPPSFKHPTPSLPHNSCSPLSSHQPTPLPSSFLLPPPSCPCSHPAPVPCCGDSPSANPSRLSDPLPAPWPRPSCMNHCCEQVGGAVPADTYQLLLHQDQQLRLLQAQVQMLLEAQGKLQSSSRQLDTQTPRSTASIAVGTGASLFWGDSQQPLPSTPLPTPPPSHDLPVVCPVDRAEDGDTGQVASCPPSEQPSGRESPVLGESVSMYRPADDQQSFYHNLMTQLTSRLQEADSRQEVEEEEFRRRSLSLVSDHSRSSSSSRRKSQSPVEDPVVTATLRQLQQLGVDVDEADLTESDRSRVKTVESVSTLASINPAAAVSRLSVSDPTVSSLFPGGSVDLSLEANAIALRYLSDSQLSRLSLGGHALQPGPASSSMSVLSPSNMSLATRKYMRRYGLIEEEDEEDLEEVGVQEASSRQPLREALNGKLLPQSQLLRDLRPKMQLLATDSKGNAPDKENCSSMRPSLVRAISRQTEGSVGNILDLSRLRQLPKLF
ncbi:SCL-interrupting locus protein homolog isoform X2 [Mastacembelus armatus]|uniref:STIL centriolar assembly protein n=1 Tax=Mastacembelus armatus TaxID=205130 RepID=A0A3Q3SGX3_9TELE|nr:SCL-interrupting locus protein isoform X2 [Mastacembelus armatus]